MNSLYGMGKIILSIGVLMTLAGGLLMLAGKFTGLGRLPGDIYIQKGNFTLYFPVISMIIISLVLTIILNLIARR